MLSSLVLVICFFFVWSTNPVHGVLSLVGVSLAFAGLLLAQGLEFPALLLVLVYVGAVTVLFIFVVIMVNLRATPVSYLTAEGYLVWAILAVILLRAGNSFHGDDFLGRLASEEIPLEQDLNLSAFGFFLYGTFRIINVVVVGLVLFVAMVAAICLSLVGGENYRTQEFYSQIRRPSAVFCFQTNKTSTKIKR